MRTLWALITTAALSTLVVWISATASPFMLQAPPPVLAVPDDNQGFEPIFNGKSLTNWEGDTNFWRVENGAIVGETTADKPLERNTFLIWRGGRTKDFELKLEYRLTGGNSGIQYRSVEVPEIGTWVLKGYQADMDSQDRYTGQLFEERGRGFLALRGQSTRLEGEKKVKILGSVGDAAALKGHIKAGHWNHFHIIARKNVLIHIVNGHVMSTAVDDDEENRSSDGVLGLQLHQGPPMKVEFRKILLKQM